MPTVVFALLVASEPLPMVAQYRDVDSIRIEGSFSVHASPHAVWNVLSDYARLPLFVDGMTRSTVTGHHASSLLVAQEAVVKVFLFSRTVHLLLDIQEVPDQSITFHDVLGEDFVVHDGAWTIDKQDAGSHVRYRLRTEPRPSVPDFIAMPLIKETAEHLLAQVRDEIGKRAILQGALP